MKSIADPHSPGTILEVTIDISQFIVLCRAEYLNEHAKITFFTTCDARGVWSESWNRRKVKSISNSLLACGGQWGVKSLLSASHELLWHKGAKFLLLVLGDVIFTSARLLWQLLTLAGFRQKRCRHGPSIVSVEVYTLYAYLTWFYTEDWQS